MGEVYRARDTKLDLDVALKVLPQAFTADPDRLASFDGVPQTSDFRPPREAPQKTTFVEVWVWACPDLVDGLALSVTS